MESRTQVVVIGAGPAGYPAAFHAADLGMDVTLIDREAEPGGVCLYRGCIPSKSLLHAAHAIELAREAANIGITFTEPVVDVARVREWKQEVVGSLCSGLAGLTKMRGIRFLQGEAVLTGPTSLVVQPVDNGEPIPITFEHAILATGSEPSRIPSLPDSSRVMDSTSALDFADIPERMLVVGGGYIGLELGQVYAAFGTKVSVVELSAALLPMVDPDLVKPLAARLKNQFERIMLNTRLVSAEEENDGLRVRFEDPDGNGFEETYDKILVAVGRRPVTAGLGLENTSIKIDEHGFIKTDGQCFTEERTIQAVGDIAGQPLLAHKATHEGRSAVAALHDGKTIYEPRAIPAVVYTDPEIAWCGLLEDEARRAGLDVRVGTFPWQASGRARTLNRPEGITKVVSDSGTGRVLGLGMTGYLAGELIGEGVLAIEMGAVAEDLALTIHAHPSFSETIMEAAENAIGQSTHFFQRM